MMKLQSSLAPSERAHFYKGAILSDVTLDTMGFTGWKQVKQQPGDIVCSHNYHFGLGFTKIAEAHSWFSGSWHLLKVAVSPEIPAAFDADLPEGWDLTRVVEFNDTSSGSGMLQHGKRRKCQPGPAGAKRVCASRDDETGAAAADEASAAAAGEDSDVDDEGSEAAAGEAISDAGDEAASVSACDDDVVVACP